MTLSQLWILFFLKNAAAYTTFFCRPTSPTNSSSKEPNIIRGGTPYLSHCDATYVAPPASGNAVDVLSVDHSISYAYGRAYGRAYGVVEE